MKPINLLPKPAQSEIRMRFFADSLLFFWSALILSLVAFLVLAWAAKFYLSGEMVNTENQILSSSQILKSSDNELLKQQVSSLNDQINAIKLLQSQHYYWSKSLAELDNTLAFDMQINLISLDRATGKVSLMGTAGSRQSVLKFWADMHKSVYFKDINFPLANLERAASDPFNFTFYVNSATIK